MELLKKVHQDFEMYIECTKFDGIWEKAKRNVEEKNLTSTYTWSEGVVSDTNRQYPRLMNAVIHTNCITACY